MKKNYKKPEQVLVLLSTARPLLLTVSGAGSMTGGDLGARGDSDDDSDYGW